MEILYSYNVNPNYMQALISMALGIAMLIAYFLWEIGKEKIGCGVCYVLACLLVIAGLVELYGENTKTYVFARINSNVSYASVAKKYDYVDNQGNIFKLRVINDD